MTWDNDRPRSAVAAAVAGAQAWRQVVHAQRAVRPNHGEFYDLASELVDTLRSVESLTAVLGRQVAGYGEGRVLRDDQGQDPGRRLRLAAAHLADTGEWLGRAERAANRFWSAIGHVAVQPDRGVDR